MSSAPVWLVVEADGGSRGNPGPAAYGAVVRRADTGEVLAEVAEVIGVATNNVAEYRGVLAGLRAARQVDPAAVVEARLDSKLIVEQMSGRWKIKSAELRSLALQARRIFPPGQVSYVWVPRAQNTHADRLVNDALDGKLGPLTAPGPPADELPKGQAELFAPGATRTTPDEPAQAVQAPAAVSEATAPANRLAAWAPELGVPTVFYLVRHGQTALTAGRRFSGGGVDGPGLDETGLRQAERAAALLADSGAVVVVSSPMTRARQTAAAVAAPLGLAVMVDDAWRECDFGVWDGLTLAEITERFPAEVAEWYQSTSVAPPGGESLDQLSSRIAAARDDVLARWPGNPVVVVTHSMPVRTMTRLALDAPPEALFRLQPAPGSVTEIQVYPDGAVAINGFGLRP